MREQNPEMAIRQLRQKRRKSSICRSIIKRVRVGDAPYCIYSHCSCNKYPQGVPLNNNIFCHSSRCIPLYLNICAEQRQRERRPCRCEWLQRRCEPHSKRICCKGICCCKGAEKGVRTKIKIVIAKRGSIIAKQGERPVVRCVGGKESMVDGAHRGVAGREQKQRHSPLLRHSTLFLNKFCKLRIALQIGVHISGKEQHKGAAAGRSLAGDAVLRQLSSTAGNK